MSPLLVLALVSLVSAAAADFCTQFNVGTEPGLNDVVAGGVTQTGNPWSSRRVRSWAVPSRLYLSMTGSTPFTNLTVQASWNLGTFYDKYRPEFTPGPYWRESETITIVAGTSFENAYLEFIQPVQNFDGCEVDSDTDAQTGGFNFNVQAPCDNPVTIEILKDCYYPSLALGSSPTSLTDLVQPSYQSTPRLTLIKGPIVLTPSDEWKTVYLSAEPQSVPVPQWPAGKPLSFLVKPSTNDNTDYPNIAVSLATNANIENPGTIIVAFDNQIVCELPFVATCGSSEIINNAAGNITVPIYFGFKNPLSLQFKVYCGTASGTKPFTALSITTASTSDLAPQLDSEYFGNSVWKSGKVQTGFDPKSRLIIFNAQQQTMAFTFEYPPGRTISATISAVVVTESANTAGGRITSTYTSDGTPVSVVQTFSFPTSGTFTLLIDSVCANNASLQILQVELDSIKESGTPGFDPIVFRYSQPCTVPVFALSTTGPSNNDLFDQGLPVAEPSRSIVSNSAFEYTVVTQLGADDRSDMLTLTLQSSVGGKTLFSWTIDTKDTVDLDDVDLSLNGVAVTPTTVRTFKDTWMSNGANSVRQLKVDFICRGAGQVKVGTVLQYGFNQPYVLHLDYKRDCTQNEEWILTESLSDGAIVAICFAVLFFAFCCLGCGYNYGKLGKSGWSIIPCVDRFNAWNDNVQGPKRYAPTINRSTDSTDVEIHSLGYGSYQHSDEVSDGYGDEVDAL